MTKSTNVTGSEAGFGASAAEDSVGMIRSEERLALGTEVVASERVRVEKYIVTEERTFTVTVRREEVRLVREPLDGTSVGGTGTGALESDGDLELTLSEEQVVVTKQIVPVERVRVRKEWHTGQQDVSATVRSERIEFTAPEA
ncbi:YsnF/AvaK domain-containing protein [Planctomonas psychrotolerans]|uniref:YsnF/AvaK domain-containing protein n=1 Tax=Planctomonas psychrotolerans TaxID=2528712 RepID=UPI001D0CF339|nr:YsnF/AvaK domain-containing protein [Planctomonas psychrotolerans]